MKLSDLIWKEKFEKFLAEVPEHQRSSSRLEWSAMNTKVVTWYYGIGCEAMSVARIASDVDVTSSRINYRINSAKKMLESYYSGKQTIERRQREKLKARFLKYFQSVPMDDWFTGRKDAPSPGMQTYAVQREFDIDCTPFGGSAVPSGGQSDKLRKRALRVAQVRLEQWESVQATLERRARLATLLKNQLREG